MIARQPIRITVEAAILSLITWLFALPPALSYGANFVAKSLIHPIFRAHRLSIKPTPNVGRQASGALWFLRIYIGFAVLRASSLWVGAAIRSIVKVVLALAPLAVLLEVLTSYRNAREYAAANFVKGQNATGRSGPYKYSPLHRRNSTRLLGICPSLSLGARIECKMATAFLHEVSVRGPAYITILYRWSGEMPEKAILIDGQEFRVTNRVYEILKYHRKTIGIMFIWIDTICINQRNEREKAVQVPLMKDIYERCIAVQCWVKTPDPTTAQRNVLAKFLLHFDQSRQDMIAYRMIKYLCTLSYLDDVVPDADSNQILQRSPAVHWRGLQEFISSRYFTRMWIIQEVVASKHVFLHYDAVHLEWSDFAQAMRVLSSHGLRNFTITLALLHQGDGATNLNLAILRGLDNTLMMESLRHCYGRYNSLMSGPAAPEMLPLQDVLQLCLRFDSGEAVNRIFALIGLVRQEGRQRIVPDYRKTPETLINVFAEAARTVLQQSNPYRALCFAGVGRQRNIDQLPSWVPYWTAGLQTAILCHHDEQNNYKASLQTRPTIEFGEEPNTVMCMGVVFDNIQGFGESIQGTSAPGQSQFRDSLALVLGERPPDDLYGKGGSSGQLLDESFYRTLIGDIDPQLGKRPAPGKDENDFLVRWRRHMVDSETELSDGLSKERREKIIDARRLHKPKRERRQPLCTYAGDRPCAGAHDKEQRHLHFHSSMGPYTYYAIAPQRAGGVWEADLRVGEGLHRACTGQYRER